MLSSYIQKITLITWLFLTLLISISCVHTNYYEDFYRSYIPTKKEQYDKWVQENSPIFLKENEDPFIVTTDNIDQSLREYLSNHYIIIGESSFHGSLESYEELQEWAKEIKATVVLKIKEKYMDSSVYGGGGGYSFTNPSTNITTINTNPIRTYHRYTQGAIFLVQAKHRSDKIGIGFRELTEKERTEYRLRKGVMVTLILKNTPAFHGGLFRGDIITHYGDTEITHLSQLQLVTKNHIKQGGKIIVQVLRDGRPKKILLEVTPLPKEQQRSLASFKTDSENKNFEGIVLKSNKNKILAKLKNSKFLKKGDKLAVLNNKGTIDGKAKIIKLSKKKTKAVLTFDRKVNRGTKLSLLDDSLIFGRGLASIKSISKTRYIHSGIIGSVIGFGSGHLFQGRYLARGWFFTLASTAVVTTGIAYYYNSPAQFDANLSDIVLGTTYSLLLAVKLWEIFDVWNLPSHYTVASKKLSIEPNLYSYNNSYGASLSLKYKW